MSLCQRFCMSCEIIIRISRRQDLGSSTICAYSIITTIPVSAGRDDEAPSLLRPRRLCSLKDLVRFFVRCLTCCSPIELLFREDKVLHPVTPVVSQVCTRGTIIFSSGSHGTHLSGWILDDTSATLERTPPLTRHGQRIDDMPMSHDLKAYKHQVLFFRIPINGSCSYCSY